MSHYLSEVFNNETEVYARLRFRSQGLLYRSVTMHLMVGRAKKKPPSKKSLTVHQVVAYNFRRAREEKGWTQAQTSDALEPYLGYRLNQAGVSAVEKTFDSDRRRNLDVAEVVAFSRCFGRPIGWFFLPPPGYGDHVDRAGRQRGDRDRSTCRAVDLAALVVGTPRGAASFRDRISELLETDADETWRAMQLAVRRRQGRRLGEADRPSPAGAPAGDPGPLRRSGG